MVCQWFDNNKLSLNLQKTKFISFQFQFIHQHVYGVYENKFLGVIIDYKLCWKPHIKQVKRKVSMSTAILYKTKDVLKIIKHVP